MPYSPYVSLVSKKAITADIIAITKIPIATKPKVSPKKWTIKYILPKIKVTTNIIPKNNFKKTFRNFIFYFTFP